LINEELVNQWIIQGEGLTTDFKDARILSHTADLARIMTAFANNKFICEPYGGKLLIGVTNDGIIDGVIYKKEHEASIMNVARDKIIPPIIPKFDKIVIKEKTIYIITIPKTISTIHNVIIKGDQIPLIRVGSTIRSPSQNELAQLMETSEKSITEIENIKCVKRFVGTSTGSYKRLIVTSKNTNSQLIEFSNDVFRSIAETSTTYVNLNYPTLHQNEIQFSFRHGSMYQPAGGFDNFGNFCFQENQDSNPQTPEQLNLGRCTIFFISIMSFIKKTYEKFGYLNNIQINFDLSIIQNSRLVFDNGNPVDTSRPFDGELVRILRITNVSTMNIIELTKSIIAEILRSFGVASDSQDVDKYVKSIQTKYFPTS